jgi:hypothetical protein
MSCERLSANQEAIRRHPDLLTRLSGHREGKAGTDYQVAPSRRGDLALVVAGADGRRFTYHSAYDPVREAEQQVAAGLTNEPTHVMVLGFGLGYAVEAVLRSLPVAGGAKRVLVVEPDVGVVETALASRDLTSMLRDSRVDWCVGMTPDEVGDRWNQSLDWTALEGLAIIDHPPSRARFGPYFTRLIEKVRYLCHRSKGNLVTLMHAGFEFHANYFANLRPALELPGVGRLFDRFTGVPAVVVAAGPSLDRNIHLLAEVKDRYLIIATDTALRQLVARGIRPHLVVAADPSYENSLDFVGVEDETEVVLAVEPMTHPDILEGFHGPKMVMTFGGGLLNLVQPHREAIGTLVCWGSIATTAFDLARRCGCDPIVFVGLDLSFQDGRLYARGSYSDDVFFDRVHHLTSVEHETADYIATRGTVKIQRADGSVLYTDQNMNLYRGWFEDQFQQSRQTIINATEGGVVTRHVQCRRFAEVMAHVPGSLAPVGAMVQAALHEPVRVDHPGLLRDLEALVRVMRHHESLVRQAVARCRKLGKTRRDLSVAALSGPEKAEFQAVMAAHDEMCDHSQLLAWLSVHQTRFVTRHTMEIKTLREATATKVGEWLAEMEQFFVAIRRFHEFQLPLLETAVKNLREMMAPSSSSLSMTPAGEGTV